MKKIKLCGMFRSQDIKYANAIKPDFVGFVFAKSKRQITLEQATEFSWQLDTEIQAVGVFVNEEIKNIVTLCKQDAIQLVQLHGDENRDYIEQLRDEIRKAKPSGSGLNPIKIIKAVRISSKEDALAADTLPVDYLLLDATSTKAVGGTGEQFDWSQIPELEHPYFLAGGIGLHNIDEALKTTAYGIDTSSGIETEGVKDPEKMRKMVAAVKQYR
ncbi:MAG: phosphoribosylanthranilate isomerase [Lachnospiraceae bacterium]|nr:phosphoribosylanthranilate isomerase [Lachnospiraceae bacterium]